MNWVNWTIVISALLRLIGCFACWEMQVKVGKSRKSYPNAPPWAPVGLFVIAAFLAGNSIDLCVRAQQVPPNPLISGYVLTGAILIASAMSHYWLQASWLPPSVQEAVRSRLDTWRGTNGPCLNFKLERRRRQRMRERAAAEAERARAAAAAQRTRFAAHGEPVHDGADAVIPPALKDLP